MRKKNWVRVAAWEKATVASREIMLKMKVEGGESIFSGHFNHLFSEVERRRQWKSAGTQLLLDRWSPVAAAGCTSTSSSPQARVKVKAHLKKTAKNRNQTFPSQITKLETSTKTLKFTGPLQGELVSSGQGRRKNSQEEFNYQNCKQMTFRARSVAWKDDSALAEDMGLVSNTHTYLVSQFQGI